MVNPNINLTHQLNVKRSYTEFYIDYIVSHFTLYHSNTIYFPSHFIRIREEIHFMNTTRRLQILCSSSNNLLQYCKSDSCSPENRVATWDLRYFECCNAMSSAKNLPKKSAWKLLKWIKTLYSIIAIISKKS